MASTTPITTATLSWMKNAPPRSVKRRAPGIGALRISIARGARNSPSTDPTTIARIEMKSRRRSSARWSTRLMTPSSPAAGAGDAGAGSRGAPPPVSARSPGRTASRSATRRRARGADQAPAWGSPDPGDCVGGCGGGGTCVDATAGADETATGGAGGAGGAQQARAGQQAQAGQQGRARRASSTPARPWSPYGTRECSPPGSCRSRGACLARARAARSPGPG